MGFKDRKLLVNVQEFVKIGNRYQINGVDLSRAIFFWRKPTGMYDTIPKGDYTVTFESNNTYLTIIDGVEYAEVESIQVCYEFASLSSEYQVDFNVDINIVKDRYNELVKDVKEIFNYVKTN
ncbi:MAG: hypothetical protein ACRC6A_05675, partial [Fusobacteriaceae bacterium]